MAALLQHRATTLIARIQTTGLGGYPLGRDAAACDLPRPIQSPRRAIPDQAAASGSSSGLGIDPVVFQWATRLAGVADAAAFMISCGPLRGDAGMGRKHQFRPGADTPNKARSQTLLERRTRAETTPRSVLVTQS